MMEMNKKQPVESTDMRTGPKEQLDEVLGTLSEKEKEILRQRYGMKDRKAEDGKAEDGKEFKVTRERVRQIEAKARKKLENH